MKKILVIPHHPVTDTTKIRLGEIAKFLAKDNDVYLLNWNAVKKDYTFKSRVIASLKDLFKQKRVYDKYNLKVVEFPILHRPLKLVPAFNSFWLKRFLKKEKMDILINGSYYMFSIPEKRPYHYFFDIADLPVAQEPNAFERFVHLIVGQEIDKADAVTVVSQGLVEYVLKTYKRKSFFVPNGADLNRIAGVKEEEVEKIRKTYGLEGKLIISYIGFIGAWVDVSFMTGVFRKVKERIPGAHLLWVGAAPNIRYLKELYEGADITFTGGITGAIEPYFKVSDIGILPHKKSLFQDVAFHIKLIEYTAAKKMVVSSPIEEVKRLGFPNIEIAEFNIEAWVQSIEKIHTQSWQGQWDNLVKGYDWNKIGKMFFEIDDKL